MSSFELSVNLEYMFGEAGPSIPERVRAVADAGYSAVEIFSTVDRDLPAICAALAETGVRLHTVAADPRTLIVDRQTHERFAGIVRAAARDAVTLGCPNVVIGSGPAVPYQKRAVQLATVTEAVASVVPIAEELGVTLLVEPVNTRVDHPGVLFDSTQDAETVIRAVDSPRVRLLYDLYHSVAQGEDPRVELPRVRDLVAHVQVADSPGRGEPGTGTVDWPAMLDLLRDNGYRGLVGVECYPVADSSAKALDHLRTLCATY